MATDAIKLDHLGQTVFPSPCTNQLAWKMLRGLLAKTVLGMEELKTQLELLSEIWRLQL